MDEFFDFKFYHLLLGQRIEQRSVGMPDDADYFLIDAEFINLLLHKILALAVISRGGVFQTYGFDDETQQMTENNIVLFDHVGRLVAMENKDRVGFIGEMQSLF